MDKYGGIYTFYIYVFMLFVYVSTKMFLSQHLLHVYWIKMQNVTHIWIYQFFSDKTPKLMNGLVFI